MRLVRLTGPALSLAFVLYVVEAAAALVFALPLGLELSGDQRATLESAVGRAAWLDRVVELTPVVRTQARSTALFALVWIALSPWLQMAWLCGLARACGVREAFARGARLYLRACRVSLLVALLLALSLLPLGAALATALWAFSEHGDAPLHDLSLAVAGAVLLLLLWTTHVLHDLARAGALSVSAWTAVRAGLRACTRPRVHARAAGFLALGLSLRGTHALVFMLGARLSPLGAVALLQVACFAALLARGAWLARALACVGAPSGSRDAA